MDEDSKPAIPMRPLRAVLAEFEKLIDSESPSASTDGPCERCNGTGSEPIRNERGVIISARPCSH